MSRKNEEIDSLVRIFGSIEDPRMARGKRHRLIDIFILTIFGLLWGFTDFVNMADELSYHEEYFTEMLGLKHGIPSHDVFSAVFRVIDPEKFLICFIEWISTAADIKGKHISIDGKAIRAACEKIHNRNAPYIVNAFLVEQNLVIGQLRVDEKTNEIKGIPELMDYLNLDGATVTIDAIGTQREICEKIVTEKNGDYVLAVKENQPSMHEMIQGYFDENLDAYHRDLKQSQEYAKRKLKINSELLEQITSYTERESNHGRIEKRTYYTSTDISCINQKLWPTVKCIGYTIRERLIIHRDENGNILEETPSVEANTWILSKEMNAAEFQKYARGHWAVENSLHYVLDTQLYEDRSTARKDHAMENLSLMRKLVLNLKNLDPVAKKKTTKASFNYFRNNPEEVWDLLLNRLPENHEKSE